MPDAQKPARKSKSNATESFTEEERAAMKERARELKATSARRSRATPEDGEADVMVKIAEMPEEDRVLAERLHALIKATAPDLIPRTWYGMPAYARDGQTILFFQNAGKFKTRYATLGFSDKAKLDDGAMWPTSYALTELTSADEERIVALVKQALG